MTEEVYLKAHSIMTRIHFAETIIDYYKKGEVYAAEQSIEIHNRLQSHVPLPSSDFEGYIENLKKEFAAL